MKSGYVAMINLSDWSAKRVIKVGNNADGIGWASSQQGNSPAIMAPLQDNTMDLIAMNPAEREAIAEGMYQLFWRAVR
jgi:hypothetical protein